MHFPAGFYAFILKKGVFGQKERVFSLLGIGTIVECGAVFGAQHAARHTLHIARSKAEVAVGLSAGVGGGLLQLKLAQLHRLLGIAYVFKQIVGRKFVGILADLGLGDAASEQARQLSVDGI